MKKVFVAIVSVCVLALLCACSGSGNTSSNAANSSASSSASSASQEPSEDRYAIGDTVKTDMAEVKLVDCQFTEKVGLDSSNWLKPNNGTGELSAGDGDVYLWLSLDAKNVSKDDLSGYDVTNIVVDYDAGYKYDDGVYTDGNYGWSTGKSVSRNNGLAKMKPLNEHNYYGYIECASAVRENREKPLLIRITLPSSEGDKEFVFEYALAEGADTSAAALATSNTLSGAIKELNFVQKYAGNVNGNGSRKFADERIDALRTSLSGLDMDYVKSNLPETAAAIPEIQSNIDTICDLLVEMGETNSDENVDRMKSMAGDTIARIEHLLSGELSAFN